MKQCAHCPWKTSTDPNKDIPNGYNRRLHIQLRRTLAKPGELDFRLRAMACHESPKGAEYPCVGWVNHQLNEGNNIALRLLARDGRFKNLQLDGEQHGTFEATLG
jgi:hypothetical protein